ncbi:TetR/AcrR family transcriptional regulator [Actinacidiphila alni]|uniref:TetR/AcrR family transcriptional regulator n=1 Tax=Actinacidiphila alni TaxID=380248 RepID=UPI0033C39654
MPADIVEPQQQRSREKFARVLEATARLLETTSYDDLGTKLIAAEAGVSIGVLYRYFPDKEAIVGALVTRWLRLDVEIAERVTAPPLPDTARDFIAGLVTAYAERFRREPGYRKVWYHGPRIPAVDAFGKETDREISAHVHRALVARYGLPDTPATRRRVHLSVDVGAHLLNLAFRELPDGDPEILADAVVMMERFLFADASAGPGSSPGDVGRP